MDTVLRTLADAGLALDAAEEALAAGEPSAAEGQLETVRDALDAVRAGWADLPPAGRAVAGPLGKDAKARHDAIVRRLPKRRALSEAPPERPDPEQEQAPAEE